MDFFVKIAHVIRIDPPHTVLLWWDGEVQRELLTFDKAGYQVMFHSLGGAMSVPEDVVRNNIREFLNNLLAIRKYDFDTNGPIYLDEARVKSLLGIK